MVDKQAFIQLAEESVDAIRSAVKRQSPAQRRTVADRRLQAAQDAQRRLVDIYDCKSSQVAYRALTDWKAALAPATRRDLGPLVAATDAWAREMFAFFDKRALTANLDDLTVGFRRIEARLAGLPFESARSEFLAAPAIKAPTGFNRCQRCGRDFRRYQVRAKYNVPVSQVARTINARLQRVCSECHETQKHFW